MKVGKPLGVLSGLALVLSFVVASPGATAANEAVSRSPAQQAGSHEVRRGDTLWDLAGRYLSDPFRWPELYDANRGVVEDPDRIYPGERLTLPGAPQTAVRPEPVVAAEDPSAAPARPEPPARVVGVAQAPIRHMPQEASEGRGVSRFGGVSLFDTLPDPGEILGDLGVEEYGRRVLVSANEFHRAPYIVERDELGPTARTARKIEESPLKLRLPPAVRLHARVVIALNGISVGENQVLEAFRWGRKLRGGRRVVQPMALLRVTSVEGDSARAVVSKLHGDYQVGDPILLAEPFPTDASERHEPVERGVVTELIGFEIRQDLLGAGDLVFLGAGSSDGVGVGDEFAVFSVAEESPATARLEDRQVIVRVVRVRATSSTARVVELRDLGTVVGSPARLIHRAVGG